MKKLIAITVVLTLALVAVSRGTDSPKGGSVGNGEGFKIDVPTFCTDVKQGEIENVSISLQRGDSFKQDVKLEIKLIKGEGLTFDPSSLLIKAGDQPEVQLSIIVAKKAAIGEYIISVTGTPTTGEATSVEFNVNVVEATAGYTLQTKSSEGGSTIKGEGFKVAVPKFSTKLNQGEIQNVAISLVRGKSFNQDVTLEFKLTKGEGITFDPAKVTIKAGDKSDVQLRVIAAKNAALGEYSVSAKGTPVTGEATAVKFNVKVVAP